MSFIKRLFRREPIIFNTKYASITFVGEQSGDIETTIKSKWITTLRELPQIDEAYLAVVDFRDSETPHPVLCLFPRPKNERLVIDLLSKDFKSVFRKEVFIDILFLDTTLKEKCKKVCQAFYIKQ